MITPLTSHYTLHSTTQLLNKETPFKSLDVEGGISKPTQTELGNELNLYFQAQLKKNASPALKQKIVQTYSKALDEAHVPEKIIQRMGLNDPKSGNFYKTHPLASTAIPECYKKDLWEQLNYFAYSVADTHYDPKQQNLKALCKIVDQSVNQVFSESIRSIDTQVQSNVQKISQGAATPANSNRLQELEDATDASVIVVYSSYSSLPPSVQKDAVLIHELESIHPNASEQEKNAFSNYQSAWQSLNSAVRAEYAAKLGLDAPGETAAWMTEHPEAASMLATKVAEQINSRLISTDNLNAQNSLPNLKTSQSLNFNHYKQVFTGIQDIDYTHLSQPHPLGTLDETAEPVDLNKVRVIETSETLAADARASRYDLRTQSQRIEDELAEQLIYYRQYQIKEIDNRIIVWDKLNEREVDASEMNALQKVDPNLHQILQAKLAKITSKKAELDNSGWYELLDTQTRRIELNQLLASSEVNVRSLRSTE